MAPPFKIPAIMAIALLCTSSATAVEDKPSDAKARADMVRGQIAARQVRDARVLAAMAKVPRHLFVRDDERHLAYRDTALPIGQGQTISQPYIVALMTELVRPAASDRVLEIGTGSGYQAAVLAEIVDHVYTIELEAALAQGAERLLRSLEYRNVTVRTGDGYAGWPEKAPFDIIVVTAAPDHVPEPLTEQLKPGGRMIIPVGARLSTQQLRLIEKDAQGRLQTQDISPVRFVPLRRAEEAEPPAP